MKFESVQLLYKNISFILLIVYILSLLVEVIAISSITFSFYILMIFIYLQTFWFNNLNCYKDSVEYSIKEGTRIEDKIKKDNSKRNIIYQLVLFADLILILIYFIYL